MKSLGIEEVKVFDQQTKKTKTIQYYSRRKEKQSMKTLFLVTLVLAIGLTVFGIKSYVASNYVYEKNYLNLWNLGEKASTIPAKAQYIAQFRDALVEGKKQGKFSEWDAVWLQTPDNNFSTNVIVLGTLVERLKEIQNMNPNSFEYNTAIQQITAQEQGEAHRMLLVFEHCWDMASYPIMWGWYNVIFVIGTAIVWLLAIVFGCCLLDL